MWLIHYESRTELFCTRKRGPGNHIRRTEIPKHAPRQPIQSQMPHRHKSLECLIDAKEMAGRMARWAMIMPEYKLYCYVHDTNIGRRIPVLWFLIVRARD